MSSTLFSPALDFQVSPRINFQPTLEVAETAGLQQFPVPGTMTSYASHVHLRVYSEFIYFVDLQA